MIQQDATDFISWFPFSVSQVLVPPGYGEDVKTWTSAPAHPAEAVKESPMVSDRLNDTGQTVQILFCELNLVNAVSCGSDSRTPSFHSSPRGPDPDPSA